MSAMTQSAFTELFKRAFMIFAPKQLRMNHTKEMNADGDTGSPHVVWMSVVADVGSEPHALMST
jgi:hypothetical protein